jgi:hypothetical protein
VSATPTPITASDGASLSTITVTVRDEFDNLVNGATVTLASVDPGTNFTQPAGTTGTNGQIAGTMSSTLAGTKTVTATANATVNITQPATVAVIAGPAAKLAFTGQPSNARANTIIAPPVVVTTQDAFGNTATDFVGAITLSITPLTGTPLALLSGTNPVSAVGGLATFSNLSIDLLSTFPPYQLDAASGSLTPTTSSRFNITP